MSKTRPDSMTKEKRREYNKKYREKKKSENSNLDKEYYEKTKDLHKSYYERDKKAFSDKNTKQYKSRTIGRWKMNGIKINEDTFNYYNNLENCELCNKKFCPTGSKGAKGNDKKCLDHCHLSGYPRFVCCNNCNNYLRIIDNNRIFLMLEIHRYFKTL